MSEEAGDKPRTSRSRLIDAVERTGVRSRAVLNVLVHAVLFSVALLATFLVRFDVIGAASLDRFSQSFLPWLPWFVLVKLLIFSRMKLFRAHWQFASIRDITGILLASWLFLAVTFLLVMVFRMLPAGWHEPLPGALSPIAGAVGGYFHSYSNGVLILDFLATVFLVCSARLGYRIYHEEMKPISSEGITRVLIVGAGNAAEAIIREINRMAEQRYRVIGLVDDDPGKRGSRIHGIPVLGTTDEIRRICEEEEVEEIIVAIPSATQKELRRVIDLCSGTKLKFQSLPSVTDLIDGRVTVSQIRPVDINDLLGRESVQLHDEAIRGFLRGRRVMITGAGGSIGSEMCRQVCQFAPGLLLLLEQAENPLFDISAELRNDSPDIETRSIVADICDRDRVMAIWEEFRPEVVIHAAAHKHVPLMEDNPGEAVKNNALGTRNVADASREFGSDEFVMISTDKAVNPSSVMGATKRVAEMYTQALNGQDGCKTQFKAVRFGNVLGSAGSVVPTFKRQIARGGPVTVTHPDMERYFMTIPEASQLVLQAAATGTGGQIYLLDMGEPVRIADLARNMITLSGFRPDEDIEIRFTGIRPGEKLFEKLRTEGEDIEPTVHPKVRIWKSQPADLEHVRSGMDRLAELARSGPHEQIVRALRSLVPEYASDAATAEPADRTDGKQTPVAQAAGEARPAGE